MVSPVVFSKEELAKNDAMRVNENEVDAEIESQPPVAEVPKLQSKL